MRDNIQPGDDLRFTASHMVSRIDDLAPQIHLTLVGIQQGVALVFLVTSVQIPRSFAWNDILASFGANHLYLPQAASLMLIILVWNQFAHATILLYWPVSNVTALVLFLFCVAEIVAFSSANDVGAWMFWIGLLLFIAAFIRRRNRAIASKLLYSSSASFQKRVWSPFAALNILAFGMISACCGIFREYGIFHLAGTVAILSRPLILFDYLAPLTLILIISFTMYQDDKVFHTAMGEFLRGSRYKVRPNGKVDLVTSESTEHASE